MSQVHQIEDGANRQGLLRAGRRMEYLSIGWTSMEAAVGIGVGVIAGSVALVGFGADSVIEVASSGILLWRLREHPNAEKRERLAHRWVGVCFLALAVYVSVSAGHDLILRTPPESSPFGMAFAVAVVIVMPLLARAKRRIAAGLHSHALHADSHQSDICVYLGVILLAGLALNSAFGWWWADPVAALCMVPIIVREGISGLRGNACTHDHAF